jgi:two-component system CheB/CheR fusion protein
MNGAVEGVVLTFTDVTTLALAEERQRTLVAELNHRVKNMLTVIVSIATRTLGRSPDPESFGRDFLERLHGMARSYELVSRDDWSEVALADIVREQLEAHVADRPERFAFGGPPVSLPPKTALSLGMIVHELGTNAVKHGCLSEARGSLEVRWRLRRGEGGRTDLLIDWIERSGSQIGKPARRGFGLSAIEREVAHGLRGRVQFEFESHGLRVGLELPLVPA